MCLITRAELAGAMSEAWLGNPLLASHAKLAEELAQWRSDNPPDYEGLRVERERRQAAEARLAALSTDVEAVIQRGCQHDMGFDREQGPLGCDLGDACVCIGWGVPLRAALSQAAPVGDGAWELRCAQVEKALSKLARAARRVIDAKEAWRSPDRDSHPNLVREEAEAWIELQSCFDAALRLPPGETR
jgi:hypothetical protein